MLFGFVVGERVGFSEQFLDGVEGVRRVHFAISFGREVCLNSFIHVLLIILEYYHCKHS